MGLITAFLETLSQKVKYNLVNCFISFLQFH